jgi:hypothetical protein
MERCKEVMQEGGFAHIEFQEVVGKSEAYYKADVQAGKKKVEIFVYDDEAGVMVDGHDWTPCERPDYDSDAELVEAFANKLAEKLANPT